MSELHTGSRLLEGEGISADYLLADRGYNSNAVLEQAQNQGMGP